MTEHRALLLRYLEVDNAAAFAQKPVVYHPEHFSFWQDLTNLPAMRHRIKRCCRVLAYSLYAHPNAKLWLNGNETFR